MSPSRDSPVGLALAVMLATSLVRAQTVPPADLSPRRGAAQPQPDASDAFFARQHLPRLQIEITPAEFAKLSKDERNYVQCTVREDDRFVYDAVGVHLKGAAGSFRKLDDRPALTLNFDKFRRGQLFHQMDKIHLNNSVQDGSLMQEAMARGLCLDAGIPTGRIGHARVFLNGRDLGLYVLAEGFDKSFLRRHYTNANGHLYDGGFCQDLDGDKKALSNLAPKGQPDLKDLWRAARIADPVVRREGLEARLDVDKFLTFLALEMMLSHWDGYAMNRNNYRLYVDAPTGRVHFFPGGMDQMFGDPNYNLFAGFNGQVGRLLLELPGLRERYRSTIEGVFTNHFRIELLHARVDQLAAKLQPHGNFAGHAAGLKQQITARAGGIARQLGAPAPGGLKFDAQGICPLPTDWTAKSDSGNPVHDTATIDGRKALQIKSGGATVASWRRPVMLERGQYVFEGRIKTSQVSESADKSAAAGLRISGSTRDQSVQGTSDWKPFTFAINVDGWREVVLVAELRASQGEAWFDLGSLRLVRK